ncbi:MAG TPA: hypothetical protein VM820_02270 [Vicinamibacterales bacterium]|jgi:hypothetical protein|nr:hypothetical protein [Vicinamibacterales bacterium]
MAKKTTSAKKKAKKAKKAKKRSRTMKAPKYWTKELVVKDWTIELEDALGSKKLDPAIVAQFEPLLLARIQQHLDNNEDYNLVRKGTHKVAKTLGTICKLLTGGTHVSLAVFKLAFALCKLHPACPAGGGSGQWCDV